MILNTIAERPKRQSKDDFEGRHFEASLILRHRQVGGLRWRARWRSRTG
jgi:hypothetical protein